MIETEEQRRWWFATHPEYSWSHRGIREGSKKEKNENDIDPKDVDDYVDDALKYETDHAVRDLLKSVKRNFGTEAEMEMPYKRLARWDHQNSNPEKKSSDNTQGNKREATFGESVLKGIQNTFEDWERWFGLGARLPPKGTPERSQIEAARNQGIKAKQAEELANIRAGGKGSGVWTQKELEGIRQNGKFPDDAQWHHDPTVANRPDLAADPRVVRPVRGGRNRHLHEGHKENWRNPKE